MRGRWFWAKWGLLIGSGAALGQSSLPQAPLPPSSPGPVAPAFPQPAGPQPAPIGPAFPPPTAPQPAPLGPAFPQSQPPGQLPPLRPVGPAMPVAPGYPGVNTPTSPNPGLPNPGVPNLGVPNLGVPNLGVPNQVAKPFEMPLPQPENRFAISATDVSVKRLAGSWQLWAGQKLLRDFGNGDKSEANAQDAARVYRDLRPTEWAVIGSPRPVVEYGLVNGRPPMTPGLPIGAGGPVGAGGPDQAHVAQAGGFGGFNNSGPAVTGAGAKAVVPIDLKTVRVEAVRGVWCVRDDSNIHFNFGANKGDAEQAVAVVNRYGFNRVGVVGEPAPVMQYLFASNEPPPQLGPFAKAQLQSQIDGLARTGIPVGGVGYVGEMTKIDSRKLEVRKDGGEWVVASGTEVIGRYGPSEWVARDAVRTMQEARFTEFCKVGSAGLTFFLADGKAPTRIPFNAQGRHFDPNTLKVQKLGERWAVTETNNRHLLDCAGADEGETLVRVLKHYQFDQLCHLGPTPKLGVSFFAKGGR